MYSVSSSLRKSIYLSSSLGYNITLITINWKGGGHKLVKQQFIYNNKQEFNSGLERFKTEDQNLRFPKDLERGVGYIKRIKLNSLDSISVELTVRYKELKKDNLSHNTTIQGES